MRRGRQSGGSNAWEGGISFVLNKPSGSSSSIAVQESNGIELGAPLIHPSIGINRPPKPIHFISIATPQAVINTYMMKT